MRCHGDELYCSSTTLLLPKYLFTPVLTLYTRHLLHKATFTPTTFQTRHPVTTSQYFYSRHYPVLPTSYYTTTPFYYQTPFTPDTFYTKHLSDQAPFTPKTFQYQAPFTPDTFYTRHLLHQTPFTPSHLSLQYYPVLPDSTFTPDACFIWYYSVLQSTTPKLLCTTKYYSNTTLYYKVLLQY